jgi:hypothetical protein
MDARRLVAERRSPVSQVFTLHQPPLVRGFVRQPEQPDVVTVLRARRSAQLEVTSLRQ